MRVGFRVSLNYFSLLTRNTFIGCPTASMVSTTPVCRVQGLVWICLVQFANSERIHWVPYCVYGFHRGTSGGHSPILFLALCHIAADRVL
jgi:hypothetical protein